MQAVTLGDALFTKTQQKVLGLLFGKPDERYYTNQIMRLAGMGRGTISRELDKLTASGLLHTIREGNQVFYQANEESPIFREVVSIVKKSFGVAEEIREALKIFDEQIELAFIYGSIAKGRESASSDIDLMLVGKKLRYGDIINAVIPSEETLKRTINPTLYEREDFVAKLEDGNSFLTRVMEQPRIMVKGKLDDFGEFGQDSAVKFRAS